MHNDTAYVFYNSQKSLDTLNKNVVEGQVVSEFPRALYAAQPFNQSRCQPLQYTCPSGPRDPDIDYFYPTEVQTHPAHQSRFSYPWCPNGYCIGNHPGRYNTPEAFRWQTSAQPEGMAPKKFYGGRYVDPNYCSSDAYNNSFAIRTGF